MRRGGNNILLIGAGLVLALFVILNVVTTGDTKPVRVETEDDIFVEEVKNVLCGEPIPIDNEKVAAKIQKEVKSLVKYRRYTMKLFKRAVTWLPKLEEIIKKHNLPTDLQYLAPIESHLTNIISPAGATGYWQFMRYSGKKMGLEINHEVDERYDPIRATSAACRYFKYAHEKLGNWANVIASYNMGVEGFQKQMKRQKKTSFYDMRLNKETARYIYKVIAFKEVWENRVKYGFPKYIKPEKEPKTETYKITESVPNLIELAESEGITYIALREFNPWIRANSLTVKSSGKFYYIKIPVEKEKYAVRRPSQ